MGRRPAAPSRSRVHRRAAPGVGGRCSIAPETRAVGPRHVHGIARSVFRCRLPLSRPLFRGCHRRAAIAFAVFGLLTSLAPGLPRRDAASALACAGRRGVVCRVRQSAALAQTLTGLSPAASVAGRGDPGAAGGPGPAHARRLAARAEPWCVRRRRRRSSAWAAGSCSRAPSRLSPRSPPRITAPKRSPAVFLAAYLGLAGPVIGLGVLTQVASTRVSLLVFAVAAGASGSSRLPQRCWAAAHPTLTTATNPSI